MSVHLRPHSTCDTLEISDEDYQHRVRKAQGGWSVCEDETEWLAKLHYLRSGFKLDKLDRLQFEKRELMLVAEWLKRMIR